MGARTPGVSVVYLGGFGRSGSTLVERVLGAVPGWVNVGEVVDLARSVAPHDELCGCGERFSACPVWSRVGEVAFGGWTDEVLERIRGAHRAAARQRHLPGLLPDLPRPRRGSAPSPALASLRADYAAIYRAVAEVTGSSVVVDASKGPALGQALAGAPDIDLRVLNVVRDPRAVAWSWQREVARPHDASGSDQMWRIPAHRAAAQWSGLQLEMASIARWGGVPSARLRYEDFVADPVGSWWPRRPTSGSRSRPSSCPPSTTARSCSSPATACPATRRASAPASSGCAATRRGPARCRPAPARWSPA